MLTTLHNPGVWDESLNLSILYCGKLKSKPRQRPEDWSGTIWTESKSKCCHTGKPSRGGAWLNPAEQSFPHWCAGSADASRGVWPPNLCWSHGPIKLSIAMPPNCSSIQELNSMIHVDPFPTQNILCFCDISPKTPSVSDLLLFCLQQNIFYSYFSCSLPWFSAWLSMPCFCMYLQGLYSFYWHFLVNMGLGYNPPITRSKGVWLTSLSKSIEKSAARYSFIFFSRDLLGISPVLCQCSGLPAPHGHLGEL